MEHKKGARFNLIVQYQTDRHIVAFIDILGASEKIKQDVDLSLNTIHNVYDETLDAVDSMFSGEAIEDLTPKISIFSDNIVLAISCRPHGDISAFIALVLFCALIQNNFLRRGFLVRGGIACGSFFSDNIMVWGQALVDAHLIESSLSIYPRIVIHPETVVELGLSDDGYSPQQILQDTDGLYFVDYIHKKLLANKSLYFKHLLQLYHDCNEMKKRHSNNIRIMQKINWYESYLLTKLVDTPEYQNGSFVDALRHGTVAETASV